MAQITRSDLVNRYPEFANAAAGLVASQITATYALLDPDCFGDLLDEAAMQHVAHHLAMGPAGNSAKLVAKDGTTVYGKRYDVIASACGAGKDRVT